MEGLWAMKAMEHAEIHFNVSTQTGKYESEEILCVSKGMWCLWWVIITKTSSAILFQIFINISNIYWETPYILFQVLPEVFPEFYFYMSIKFWCQQMNVFINICFAHSVRLKRQSFSEGVQRLEVFYSPLKENFQMWLLYYPYWPHSLVKQRMEIPWRLRKWKITELVNNVFLLTQPHVVSQSINITKFSTLHWIFLYCYLYGKTVICLFSPFWSLVFLILPSVTPFISHVFHKPSLAHSVNFHPSTKVCSRYYTTCDFL